MEIGKIVIKDKVYFEPEGLEKPHTPLFTDTRNLSDKKTANNYLLALTKYEASKQLIEVSNEYAIGSIYINCVFIYLGETLRKAKNNQPCKAEVNGKTCKIIELTKQ